MQHRKITDADIAQYGMTAQPDRMIGSPAENKAAFDRLVRDCVRVQFNALSDDLSDPACAAALGAANGTVQEELDEKAANADLSAHTQNRQNPHGVTKAQVGLSAVANERQYSAQNPPPYPIRAVSLGETPLVPDANGKVTVPEAPDPPVASVSVGGESVAPTGGNVDIPLANKARPGVVKPYNKGIVVETDGVIRTDYATEDNIRVRHIPDAGNRKNSFRPITTANLDCAVKAALCDDQGDAWTASEKSAARARLGLTGDTLTHLGDIVTRDNADEIEWLAPRALRTLCLRINAPACDTAFYLKLITGDGEKPDGVWFEACAEKASVMTVIAECRYGRIFTQAAQEVGGQAKNALITPDLLGKISADGIVGFDFGCDSDALPDGVVLTVDGIEVDA